MGSPTHPSGAPVHGTGVSVQTTATFAQWVQQLWGGCVFLCAATVVTASKGAAAMWVENLLCLVQLSHVARCCCTQRSCSMLEGCRGF